jgi:hypothetical protein
MAAMRADADMHITDMRADADACGENRRAHQRQSHNGSDYEFHEIPSL